jgi:quercetin dioxygenase-like cupin family protein
MESEMVNVKDLELIDAWSKIDPSRQVRFQFPIFSQTGAKSTAVVYFEVEPGKHLGMHTDSAEEVAFIVAGRGEGIIGDQRSMLEPGSFALIPAMVPHDVINNGKETLRVVGFFSSSTIVSVFEDAFAPIGKHVLGTPLPSEPDAAAA